MARVHQEQPDPQDLKGATNARLEVTMGYGDSPAAKSSPTKARAKKPKKAKKAKAAKKLRTCKYGRGDDGYCNKRPSRYQSEGSDYDVSQTPAQRRRSNVGKSKTEREVTRVAEKVAGAGLEAAARFAANPEARAAIGTLGRTSVSDLAKAGSAGAAILGATALAGVAAFALTSYLIHRKPKAREEKLAAAAEAAQAYRAARLMAAEAQGRPLTAAQQKTLAAAFKSKLAALGVTSFSQKG